MPTDRRSWCSCALLHTCCSARASSARASREKYRVKKHEIESETINKNQKQCEQELVRYIDNKRNMQEKKRDETRRKRERTSRK
jgi:hypothetical protein